jgi:hypothetical protein
VRDLAKCGRDPRFFDAEQWIFQFWFGALDFGEQPGKFRRSFAQRYALPTGCFAEWNDPQVENFFALPIAADSVHRVRFFFYRRAHRRRFRAQE